jgi:hypothetical protein
MTDAETKDVKKLTPMEKHFLVPELRPFDIFPTHAAEPDQINPPYGLANPSTVATSPVPHDRYTPYGMKPTYHGFEWYDYKGRYLIPDPNPSFFQRLFGRNNYSVTNEEQIHPCHHATKQVTQCLENYDNAIGRCRSAVNVMEGCFREYKW